MDCLCRGRYLHGAFIVCLNWKSQALPINEYLFLEYVHVLLCQYYKVYFKVDILKRRELKMQI